MPILVNVVRYLSWGLRHRLAMTEDYVVPPYVRWCVGKCFLLDLIIKL